MTKQKAFEKFQRLQTKQNELYKKETDEFVELSMACGEIIKAFEVSPAHYEFLKPVMDLLASYVCVPPHVNESYLRMDRTDWIFDWDVFYDPSEPPVFSWNQTMSQVVSILEDCVNRYNIYKDIEQCQYDFNLIFRPLLDFKSNWEKSFKTMEDDRRHNEIIDAITAPRFTYGFIYDF